MMMTPNQRVAVITDASSGIGHELSLTLARNGILTYATMRNLNKSENLRSLAEEEKLPLKIVMLDVTDDRSVKNGMQLIAAEANRIDVLVNNDEYALIGAFEDLTIEEIKTQYDTNLFGDIRMTQAVLPIMRKQKSGIIVNMNSVVGRYGFPGASAFVSTKFAVEGLSESMAYELEPFGIKVVLIERGAISTNFFTEMVVAKKSQDPNSPYSQLMQDVVRSFKRIIENSSSADVLVKVVLNAVTSENPSFRYLSGNDAEMRMEERRSMSDQEFFKVIKQLLNWVQ
jgi:NAD(P)-dependent dehydrogenase (short-subunit alcohol dehydrogenase family)